jgi:hypothetical protein
LRCVFGAGQMKVGPQLLARYAGDAFNVNDAL